VVSRNHDLHLGSRFTPAIALGFIPGSTLRFTRLPVAAGVTSGTQVVVSGVQVVVPNICQFDALENPEDRPPSVVDTMLSGVATSHVPRHPISAGRRDNGPAGRKLADTDGAAA
jgi:hypothetical protein